MKKFRIAFAPVVTVFIEVEAENMEEAVDKATEELYISNYLGNGGYDKLLGVRGDNQSISYGDDYDVVDDLNEEINKP